MATEWAYPAWPFVEYDGTNSAEICAAIEEHSEEGATATVLAEGSGSVTIDVEPGHTYTIQEGYHFGVTSGHNVSPADWAARYVKV